MYISNITNEYDNITYYDNITSSNCTNNEKIIKVIIPLFTIISC